MSVYGKLEDSVQKSLLWFKELRDSHDAIASEEEALAVFRSVIHVLRDRMTLEETAHLSAQLPTAIRGIYFEGWEPAGKPTGLNEKEFITKVQESLVDRNRTIDAELATSLVFDLLENHITEGEVKHIRSMLPKGLDKLWEQKKAA